MCLSAVLILLFCVLAGKVVARPKVFVPDPITGYAIGGHDPVSYFVDGQPRKGKREHEYKWGGGAWIFVNEGNMAAFARDPEAYAPMFAGCGGYALSEGFATAGNPFIYAVVDGRLVFFHSVVNRFLFVVNGSNLVKLADENAGKVGCVPIR
ncbi:YHS domain-containing (seleno)protein [Roseibium sediminicola]|uniref:Twin-arginine translocation pathway signal protein n=1 Tax=Roseibium sediminicola TaxID=2933272 RepID=A0ABT0GUV0_9HYPH|nr:YHS domain-containing (seleno)protein [Roseibium sp. CAU 1639]MCK7613202.1 twin-arginine translocation pathway signal protein [Roseibium sp. CAU 1639]